MEKEKVLFVVLGGTGDLTTRKLFPAFVDLIEKELIDKNSVFLGMSRKDFTDSDYKEFLVKNSKIKDLKDIKLRYLRGDFTDFSGIKSLKEFLSINSFSIKSTKAGNSFLVVKSPVPPKTTNRTFSFSI